MESNSGPKVCFQIQIQTTLLEWIASGRSSLRLEGLMASGPCGNTMLSWSCPWCWYLISLFVRSCGHPLADVDSKRDRLCWIIYSRKKSSTPNPAIIKMEQATQENFASFIGAHMYLYPNHVGFLLIDTRPHDKNIWWKEPLCVENATDSGRNAKEICFKCWKALIHGLPSTNPQYQSAAFFSFCCIC